MKPVVITDPPRADAPFARGELSLDRYQVRAVLERLGVTYLRADHEEK